MLKSKNLTSVLSQSIQVDKESSTIISSILCTSSGRPVASRHNSQAPPLPHTNNENNSPYQIDRTMKSKVYGLLGSQAWQEYSHANSGCKWLSIATSDALLLVHPVELKSGQLLLLLVADPTTALGMLERKARETVTVLQDGLADFKVYD